MATVTLHDGRQVDSYSEEWRHECEARTVLAMPLGTRRDFLRGYRNPDTGREVKGVLQIRGLEQVQRLEETMFALWVIKQGNQLAGMSEGARQERIGRLSKENGSHIIERIEAHMRTVLERRTQEAANDNQNTERAAS